MKRTAILTLALAFVLLAGATTQAEYGEWEYLTGMQPPGYSNASFLNISVADADNMYTVGIHQPAMDRIVYGWHSGDGGTTWDETMVMNYSGGICDMMQMFTFLMAVTSAGPDKAVFGGFGPLEWCYQNLPEPWCMFLCMFTLTSVMYYTDDGGETLEQADVPFGFGKAVIALDHVEGDLVYAAGGDDLIMRSYDAGKTWESVPTMPAPGLAYSDIDFVSETVGFVVTGEAEPEPEPTKDMTEEEYNWRLYEHYVNHVRFWRDPAYQIEVRERYAKNGVPKGLNGRIFRTVDGGNSWEEVLFSHNESFGQIMMIDENEGWVMSSPLDGLSPAFGIYRTTDGGDTWEDFTDRIPMEELSGLAYGIMSLSVNPAGTTVFLVGAAQAIINYKSLLFYSVDRGETWHMDRDLLDWGHPMVAVDWADAKLGYNAGADLSCYRYTQINLPPIADAGDDRETVASETAALDGSGSYDPDGDDITYAWTQLDGPSVDLADADGVAPTFTPTESGDYTFELVVDDGEETGSDEVIITVTEAPTDDDTDDDDTVDDDDNDDNDDDDANIDGDDDDDNDSNGCGC